MPKKPVTRGLFSLSNLSSSRPPLSDDERKKVREVLDEACRAMLSKRNGTSPAA